MTWQKNKYLNIAPTRSEKILWLNEEQKEKATTFETIQEALKVVGELFVDWSYGVWTILEEETYYPAKQVEVSQYR